MKKIFTIIISLIGVIFVSSCDMNHSKTGELGDTYTIVESYALPDGLAYILDNGWEVCLKGETVVLCDKNMKALDWCYYTPQVTRAWQKAQVGQEVELKKVTSILKFYLPVELPDYVVVKTIVKVNKYDGQLSKLDGHMNGGFLGGSSGRIRGDEMGSDSFFVNLYFEDGTSASVSGKDNLFLLDVEVGDKVIEKRINNVVFYSPKF